MKSPWHDFMDLVFHIHSMIFSWGLKMFGLLTQGLTFFYLFAFIGSTLHFHCSQTAFITFLNWASCGKRISGTVGWSLVRKENYQTFKCLQYLWSKSSISLFWTDPWNLSSDTLTELEFTCICVYGFICLSVCA